MRLARSPVLWFFLFLSCYLAGRIAGPDDLNTKDQPRTVAYTVDILQNGRWKCPVDMMGQPATKPPLYNWIAALPIAATGIHHSFTFKLPSLLAGLGCLLFTALFLLHLRKSHPEERVPFAPVFGLAALAWLANPAVYGLIYTARPDMLLAFFLFAAWTISTLLMDDSALIRRARWPWSLALWLCVLAAVFTKGTPAILAVLYIPLYALIRFRSLRPALHTHIWIGLPAVALLTFFWVQSVWHDLPQTHKDLLVTMESSRVTGGGVMKTLKGIYKMPLYFLVRFAPWSLIFLWLFLHVHRARPSTAPWSPVYVWFLLLLVFFSIPSFKRDDYLLPLYPVCALAAGYAVWSLRGRLLQRGVVGAALALIGMLIFQDFFTKDHLMPRFGDNCARFARTVRETVPQQAHLVFDKTGYNSLQAYLGKNTPPAPALADSLKPGDFLLRPAYLLSEAQARSYRFQGADFESYEGFSPHPGPGLKLLALSAPLYNVSGSRPGIIGLYQVLPAPSAAAPRT